MLIKQIKNFIHHIPEFKIAFFLFFNNGFVTQWQKHVPKRVIITIARMLLTAIYQIIKKAEPYNAELYRKADLLPLSREITPEQDVYIAQRQSCLVKAPA